MIVKPMLAETGDTASLNRKDWLYEDKLDGVRCIAYLDGTTQLQSRSGSVITRQFPELAELHRQAVKPCILDGEIISLSFNAIQHRIHQEHPLCIRIAQKQYPAVFNAFDILYVAHQSIEAKPLVERKAILSTIFTPTFYGRVVPYQTAYGVDLLEQAKRNHQEGIMAKALYGRYLEGMRCPTWLKVKNFQEGVYCICGVTQGENDRSQTFGSLILGEVRNGKLEYVGNVGSGFSQVELRMMLQVLQSYLGECPFGGIPQVGREVQFWTHPELRCEVRYLELSPEGKLRFPTFRQVVK